MPVTLYITNIYSSLKTFNMIAKKKNLFAMLYRPEVFSANPGSLLSNEDWKELQIFINDLVELPTDPVKMPYEDVRKIYTVLNAQGKILKTDVLSKAQKQAEHLYDYGSNASSAVDSLAQILESAPESVAEITPLFKGDDGISSTATKALADAKELSAELIKAADTITSQMTPLKNAVQAENVKIEGDQGEIKALDQKIKAKQDEIATATKAILSDKSTIKDSVKYAWVFPIGTIAALVKMKQAEGDIDNQMNIIDKARKEILQDVQQKRKEIQDMIAMKATIRSNNNLIASIKKVSDIIAKVEGAWSAIVNDLTALVTLLDKLEKEATSGKSSSSVLIKEATQLKTVVKEWDDVANEANEFTRNFKIGIVQA